MTPLRNWLLKRKPVVRNLFSYGHPFETINQFLLPTKMLIVNAYLALQFGMWAKIARINANGIWLTPQQAEHTLG